MGSDPVLDGFGSLSVPKKTDTNGNFGTGAVFGAYPDPERSIAILTGKRGFGEIFALFFNGQPKVPASFDGGCVGTLHRDIAGDRDLPLDVGIGGCNTGSAGY
jgi:hypothetical protein